MYNNIYYYATTYNNINNTIHNTSTTNNYDNKHNSSDLGVAPRVRVGLSSCFFSVIYVGYNMY